MTATFITNRQRQIESLLPAYIAQQRWFGGKSRTIASARIASTTPIGETALIALVEITYTDNSETDLYQLPLALATEEQAAALQATAPKAIIATLDGRILIDASADTVFQQSLLHLITGTPGAPPSPTVSSSAKVGATRSSALDPARFADLPSRLSSAEQSNTSILYPPLAILKLFRHLRPGAENPNVEIARFLTDVAQFNATPTYLGDIHRASDQTTLAFLQSFVPNEGDGWDWTLTQLEAFYKSVPDTPIGWPIRPAAGDSYDLSGHAGTYLYDAALLGKRTAELHLALATPTEDPAFAAEPHTSEDLAADQDRITAQLNGTLDALRKALRNLTPSSHLDTSHLTPLQDPSIVSIAQTLLDHHETLLTRIQSLTSNPAAFGQRIRIHGDYHLGQLLRTKDDFLIVDFEGEPARTLAERRQKQSPLRDVAGMLRSFSYAAHTGLVNAVQHSRDEADSLIPWATAWETEVSRAFLDSYRNTMATNPTLLPLPEQQDALLNALLLEKALYELRYELNNRPAWLPIPLKGLLSISKAASQEAQLAI